MFLWPGRNIFRDANSNFIRQAPRAASSACCIGERHHNVVLCIAHNEVTICEDRWLLRRIALFTQERRNIPLYGRFQPYLKIVEGRQPFMP